MMMTSGYFENRIFNNGSLSVSPSYIFSSRLSIYIKLTISVWADNADACSTQYAGTGALKTDFTRQRENINREHGFRTDFRTGQRTKLGLLMDGKNSAIRYYKNNFCDGYRQVTD